MDWQTEAGLSDATPTAAGFIPSDRVHSDGGRADATTESTLPALTPPRSILMALARLLNAETDALGRRTRATENWAVAACRRGMTYRDLAAANRQNERNPPPGSDYLTVRREGLLCTWALDVVVEVVNWRSGNNQSCSVADVYSGLVQCLQMALLAPRRSRRYR